MIHTTFIHFFGAVFDSKQSDLGIGEPEQLPVDIFILPGRVEAVRENIGDNGEPEGCIIYLYSRESFWVEDSADVVLARLGINADRNERITIK